MRDGREGGRETTPEVLQFAVGQTGSPGLDEDVADGSWLRPGRRARVARTVRR